MTAFRVHTSPTTTLLIDAVTNAASELNLRARGESATYDVLDLTDELFISGTQTVTVERGETREQSLITIEPGGELIVNGFLKADEIDNRGTITILEELDLGGVTIPSGETREERNVLVPAGETLTINGTLKTDQIEINGRVGGSGSLIITDDLTINDGTLTVNDKFAFEYSEVDNLASFAGKYQLSETRDGTQRFFQTFPSGTIDSLLVGVEPIDLADDEITGVWGVIDNLQDNRNPSLADGPRIRLELTVLAPFGEYQSYQAATDALEI